MDKEAKRIMKLVFLVLYLAFMAAIILLPGCDESQPQPISAAEPNSVFLSNERYDYLLRCEGYILREGIEIDLGYDPSLYSAVVPISDLNIPASCTSSVDANEDWIWTESNDLGVHTVIAYSYNFARTVDSEETFRINSFGADEYIFLEIKFVNFSIELPCGCKKESDFDTKSCPHGNYFIKIVE